ncbi:hypothetical protein GNI_141400 [Gregarina niphandrodes]|uniref:Uncharacterized protein n=1 Tax=Gregarina niphandrodes TaxID=110365 RepID=A0A023B082_GRENI|nr:hypothetical protein GNI_141400 [Gregarina niphandrodes]EZG45042.1 hypothetical protein GNI_141400 [Gregarina niphandrodes]|eukprot:XP_011132591.1 hypothetical protein GNI_141400 [Gregarina niphandrodes]
MTVPNQLSLFTQSLLEEHYEIHTGSLRRSQFTETDGVMLASIKNIVNAFCKRGTTTPLRSSATPVPTPSRTGREGYQINEELVRERALKNIERVGMVEQYDVDLIMYLMYRIRSMGDDDSQRTRNNEMMIQFLRIFLQMYKIQLEHSMRISVDGETVDIGQLARMVSEGKDRGDILCQDVSQLEKQSKDVRGRMAELQAEEKELGRSCAQLEADVVEATRGLEGLTRRKPALEEAITTGGNLRKQLEDLEETVRCTRASQRVVAESSEALRNELQSIYLELTPQWESCRKRVLAMQNIPKLSWPESIASAMFPLSDPFTPGSVAEWYSSGAKDQMVTELERFLKHVQEQSEKRRAGNSTAIKSHSDSIEPMRKAVMQSESDLVAIQGAIKESKAIFDTLTREAEHTTSDLETVQSQWQEMIANHQTQVKQLEDKLRGLEADSSLRIRKLSTEFEQLVRSIGDRLNNLTERYETWTKREKPALDNVLDQKFQGICATIQSQNEQMASNLRNGSEEAKPEHGSLPSPSSPLTEEEEADHQSSSEEEFKEPASENRPARQPEVKDGLMKFLFSTISKLTDKKI